MGAAANATDILDYWFGDLDNGFADERHRKRWFRGGPAVDREIGERFGSLIQQATTGGLDAWLEEPTGTLAFILVCDQFSRQVYRGSRLAFAADPVALKVARAAIDARLDRSLTWDERAFLYLPFEHSESVVDQHTAVGLFALLRDETPQGYRHLTGDYLRHAQQHRDVVLRFGRFPHRNAVLGRESSTAELAFLETGPDFGQADPAAPDC